MVWDWVGAVESSAGWLELLDTESAIGPAVVRGEVVCVESECSSSKAGGCAGLQAQCPTSCPHRTPDICLSDLTKGGLLCLVERLFLGRSDSSTRTCFVNVRPESRTAGRRLL